VTLAVSGTQGSHSETSRPTSLEPNACNTVWNLASTTAINADLLLTNLLLLKILLLF
jgi:hypothetical protein